MPIPYDQPTEVVLGKDIVSNYTGIANDDIRNVNITREVEKIDTTARGSNGYKEFDAGFATEGLEIECLNHDLEVGDKAGDMVVTNITTNEPLDDVVSYNITLKPGE